MRYTIILTPTAKSDMVSLKLSLEQRLTAKTVIKKELESIYKKISSLTTFPERYPIINSEKNTENYHTKSISFYIKL